MAKGNLFLGHARGKVGSVVFSRVNGKQITRSKAETVKNPRSAGQNVQRAIFATVTVAAKYLNDLVDHTFDGTANGADDRNRFASLNVGMLRTAYTNGETIKVLEKGANVFTPNPYIISEGDQGSMPQLTSAAVLQGHENDQNVPIITVGDIKQLYPKVKAGSQVTIVAVWANDQDSEVARIRLGKCRFVLAPSVTDSTIVFDLDEGVLNAAAVDTAKTLGFGEIEDNATYGRAYDITAASNDVPLNFSQTDLNIDDRGDYIPVYKGVIITNQVDGEYKHSSCQLQKITDFGWYNEQEAIESYGNVAARAISTSDLYADQAEEDAGYVSYGSLNEAISGTIQSQGYQAKALNMESSNSYGPIPEGNYVDIWLQAQPGVSIPINSISVLAGETAVTNLWKRAAGNGNYLISFPIAFGTSTSVQYSLRFDVGGAVDWENMGFRVTVAKVQG